MKRLLRSVIDFDGKLTKEDLVLNFQKLMAAQIDWGRPDDERVYNYTLGFFQQNLELPSGQTCFDYFDGIKDVETTERLKDVQAAAWYTRTNYSHLLKTILEEQQKLKAVALLKEAHEIITRGLEIEGERKVGIRDGLMHFSAKANDLIVPDFNSKTYGDVRDDGQSMIDEYTIAEVNKGKVYGAMSGIDEIDVACRGAKKGELWIHAGFPGELKCLAGDATVFDHRTSRRRRLKEMYDCGDLPIVTALKHEGAEPHLVLAPASHLIQNGEREVFDLTLQSGRTLGATSNHKFFTLDGWKTLADLSEGDFVATPKFMPAEGFRAYSVHEVKLVGYLIGDGRTEETITFTQDDESIRNDFISCLNGVGLIEGEADYERAHFTVNFPATRTPYVYVSRGLGDRWHRVTSPIRLLLERLGLYGSDSYDKRVPSEFFGLPEDLLSVFLGALWSTDGSCCARDFVREGRAPQAQNSIQYHSVSHGLCLDVQSLLLRLGIQSTVTSIDTTLPDARPYRFWVTRVVTNPSKRLFCKRIRVIGKEASFDALVNRLPEGDNTLLPSTLLPDGERVMINGNWRYARTARNNHDTVSADVAAKFGVKAGDIAWERVRSVVLRGVEMTYDLSVPDHHTFVANDIITHNTSLALNWCYNLVTHYRTNVVYVSLEMPYEQIRRNLYAMHTSNVRWLEEGHKPLDYRKIRDGELTPEEKEFYLKKVIPDFCNNPRYTHCEVVTPDREMTMADIRMQVELFHKQFEVGFVVIDHGQWVEARKAKRSKDYVVELNSVVRDAKRFALHFNHREGVPVLLLWQINREGKTDADKHEGVYNAKALTYANECLVGGTLVKTDAGLVAIEQVPVGAKVWSRSGWKTVLTTFDQGVRQVFKLRTQNGVTLRGTGSHRIRVLEDRTISWKTIAEIRPGELVVSDMSTLKSTLTHCVESVFADGTEQVYDLEVDGDHEYATAGLLSHNCEKTADVITTTYLNDDHRKNGTTKISNLKNRDNPIFAPFLANVDFISRRIKGIDKVESPGRGMATSDDIATMLSNQPSV